MSTPNPAAPPLGPSAAERPRRAAFVVHPHPGGTFTVFKATREALAPLGIQLDWIVVTNDAKLIAEHGLGLSKLDMGGFVLTHAKERNDLCAELIKGIVDNGYEIVFVNVLTSPIDMSVAAYLPGSIRRVMIAHNITPGTYQAARAVAPFVNLCVGVSPRIERDLKRILSKSRVACIPNAMDFSAYDRLQRSPGTGTFRLVSVGRIVDADKGVFWLPKIMARLEDLPVHLTIAGWGPDLEALKQRCAPLSSRITFAGTIPPADIPQLMADHDAFIMPSRFEGFGYTLVEAMAAGCVPVSSRIGGVTDFVVEHEKTGLLFPMGDVATAAKEIRRLATDTTLRQRLVDAGRKEARARFSIAAMTEAYRPLMATLEQAKPTSPPRNRASVELLTVGGKWRRFLPRKLKNFLREKLFS